MITIQPRHLFLGGRIKDSFNPFPNLRFRRRIIRRDFISGAVAHPVITKSHGE
jgi:hypothetical protein